MEMYLSMENLHQGQTAVIMANGPTLTNNPLGKIPSAVSIIGVNRSYEVKWPDYHCATDEGQLRRAPGVYRHLSKLGRLFVPDHWPLEHRVPACQDKTFSLDLKEGAVGSIQGVGSAAYWALQVTVWLGFTQIYFLGLDLGWVGGRSHFYPSEITSLGKSTDQDPFLLARMNTLFLEARKNMPDGVMVGLVNSPSSKCTAFPKVRWPW